MATESSNGGSSCRLKGLEGLRQHNIGLGADNEIWRVQATSSAHLRISKKRMMLADLPGNFNQALARSFCRGSAWSPAVTRSSVLKNVTDAVQRVALG